MNNLHARLFKMRVREQWFDRFCHFLIGAAIFGLVVGVVVSQARAQNNPAISNPVLTMPGAAPAAPQAVDPADNDDIRDIHGPISIPYAWMWIIYIASALIAAGLTWWLWRWYRNRQLERIKFPHEIALEALDRARSLMRTDSVRAYSFALSEIVRNYIEARFNERASHRTTEEFLHDLLTKSHSPLAAQSALLEDFLTDCDVVKFGRAALNDQQMEAMHTSARNFVLATRPVPENPSDARTLTHATAT